MYWQEKIDLVKKEFPISEFNDPFTNGNKIIKTIICRFMKSTPSNFYQSNDRTNLIKNGILVKQCPVAEVYQNELEKLKDGVNYWLFLINMPMGENFKVYDCQKEVLRHLLYLSSGLDQQEFYIGDKKYEWILYFKLDRIENHAEIYNSGKHNII